MKTHSTLGFLMAGALVTMPFALFAQTEENQDKARGPVQSGATALSPGVEEILKMMDAKVSTEVIKAYVETTSTASSLGAEDIVALKAHAVPDDITTALVKRSAEVREKSLQSGANSAAKGTTVVAVKPGAAVYARSHGLDPESYEYFQYYHLHPRTLSSVYQRLSPYYPRSYGYNPLPPYGLHYSGRHSRFHRGGLPPYHGSSW